MLLTCGGTGRGCGPVTSTIRDKTYLRWLADLLSDDLPLVGLVLLDGVQERGALLLSQRQGYV